MLLSRTYDFLFLRRRSTEPAPVFSLIELNPSAFCHASCANGLCFTIPGCR
jgi:hypothetical protein